MSTLRHQVVAQFPLAKYSYAETLANQHGPVNWTHLQSGDLNVLVEKDSSATSSIGALQQRLRLRVARAHENLEDLDLNSLAREATQQAIAKHQRNTKPSVAIIVKDPCLAVRYPFSRDQTRRFQLKFSSSRDYRDVLEILKEINCPFSEAATEHPSRSASLRPDSSSSRMMTPATSINSGSNDWSQRFGRSTDSQAWNQGLARSHTTLGQPANVSSPASISRTLYATSSNIDDSHSGIVSDGAVTSTDYASKSRERPLTSPAYDIERLDQVLPPKRDLPFSKPGPRPSHLPNRQPANRFTNIADAKPPPNSSASQPVSPRPHTAQSKIVVPAMSSPARQLRLELEDRQSVVNPDKRSVDIPASSPLLTVSTVPASSPSAGRALPQNETTPGPITTAPALDTQQPSPAGVQTNVSISAAQGCPPQGTPLSSADLSTFLETPESERSQLVSNWICQQLEDDGFQALCQDVERVWQRIAFGS